MSGDTCFSNICDTSGECLLDNILTSTPSLFMDPAIVRVATECDHEFLMFCRRIGARRVIVDRETVELLWKMPFNQFTCCSNQNFIALQLYDEDTQDVNKDCPMSIRDFVTVNDCDCSGIVQSECLLINEKSFCEDDETTRVFPVANNSKHSQCSHYAKPIDQTKFYKNSKDSCALIQELQHTTVPLHTLRSQELVDRGLATTYYISADGYCRLDKERPSCRFEIDIDFDFDADVCCENDLLLTVGVLLNINRLPYLSKRCSIILMLVRMNNDSAEACLTPILNKSEIMLADRTIRSGALRSVAANSWLSRIRLNALNDYCYDTVIGSNWFSDQQSKCEQIEWTHDLLIHCTLLLRQGEFSTPYTLRDFLNFTTLGERRHSQNKDCSQMWSQSLLENTSNDKMISDMRNTNSTNRNNNLTDIAQTVILKVGITPGMYEDPMRFVRRWHHTRLNRIQKGATFPNDINIFKDRCCNVRAVDFHEAPDGNSGQLVLLCIADEGVDSYAGEIFHSTGRNYGVLDYMIIHTLAIFRRNMIYWRPANVASAKRIYEALACLSSGPIVDPFPTLPVNTYTMCDGIRKLWGSNCIRKSVKNIDHSTIESIANDSASIHIPCTGVSIDSWVGQYLLQRTDFSTNTAVPDYAQPLIYV